MLDLDGNLKIRNSLPVVFVHKGLQVWKELLSSDVLPQISELSEYLKNGRDVWIITTYILLKSKGHNVTISPCFIDGAICIAHYDDIDPSDYPLNSFVVSIRADRDRTFICDMEIVQSQSSIESKSALFIPHWPQPGIIPRDSKRGDEISRIAYFGIRRNLAEGFKSAEFKQLLEEIGVSFIIKNEKWNDYSDVDIVIAVRSGSPYFLASKPATKLVNAWLGGCPAILGHEPAYEQLRYSELDYFTAKTPKDVIDIIKKLKGEPTLYKSVISNGKIRSREYNSDKIVNIWERNIFGLISDNFKRWKYKPSYSSKTERRVKYVYRYVRRILRGQKYVRAFDENGRAIKIGLLRRVRNFFF